MIVSKLGPGETTTRSRLIEDAESLFDSKSWARERVAEKVNAQVEEALAQGTLIENQGKLRTRNDATSWALEVFYEPEGIRSESDQ